MIDFFSTAIVFLIVIVITIKLYDQKNEIYWKRFLVYIKYLKLFTLEKHILIFPFYK
jgi:hypothetical protein